MSQTCNKVGHSTKEAAKAAAIASKHEFKVDVKLVPYRCKNCDLWHLASRRDEDYA